MKEPAVYIMANKRNGTLYVGVTGNLAGRVMQHKQGLFDGFTRRYGLCLLVWYEVHDRFYDAFDREKKIKRWRRRWKLALIETMNPDWNDLYNDTL